MSAERVIVSDSSYRGLNLPSLSKTAMHLLKVIDFTTPFLSAFIFCGPKLLILSIPSSSPSFISIVSASISSNFSMHTSTTDSTPFCLNAVLATSYATLPPPITTTLGPIATFLSVKTSLRKSIPPRTSLLSEPSTGSILDFRAPAARSTASDSSYNFLSRISLPI